MEFILFVYVCSVRLQQSLHAFLRPEAGHGVEVAAVAIEDDAAVKATPKVCGARYAAKGGGEIAAKPRGRRPHSRQDPVLAQL